MTCSLLPVVLPRPGPILVVLWIGQWACSYLSCFGFVAVGLLSSLDLFSGLSCAQKGLFSCTIILLIEPMFPRLIS